MGNIYWLASYPKSGNTWMRILLTNYLRNADEPADINSLDGGPIASARQIFDDAVGIEASDLTQEEIERYRPFVYEQISEKAKEKLFLKIHDAYTYTPYGYPLISKKATAGVIYLIRNPLDVAVSFAAHSNSTVEKMVEGMGKSDYSFVEQSKRLHNQLRQRLLSWSGHINSWVDEPDLQVKVVRYEDLKADTVSKFREVIQFCELEDDLERITKAVEFSRFEKLQQQEQEKGFQERVGKESFFRSGKAGIWRKELNSELIEKILTEHQEVMLRFGYLTELGELL